MCNDCNCEEYLKCSIVGHIPIGFCCPKCDFYVEEGVCLRLKNKVKKKIPSSLKDESGKISLFSDKFCLKKKRQIIPNNIEDQ